MTTKEQINEIKENLRKWVREAQENYNALDNEMKIYVQDKVAEFNRKNSKRLANCVAVEIAQALDVVNPLDYCLNWKFDAFYGIDYVADQTIRKLRE